MEMKRVMYLLLLPALLLVSCDRIRNKSREVAGASKQKAKEEAEALADKLHPRFDSDTPDTKYNKARFADFVQVDLTPDIKNIYCFDDAIGIDADYQFSFNCDTATARRIIEKHQLQPDTSATDYGFGLQTDFPWWDKKKIEKLTLYKWKGDQEYYRYFWYDKKEGKAYFFDFDM
jgi:hypothetical protein